MDKTAQVPNSGLPFKGSKSLYLVNLLVLWRVNLTGVRGCLLSSSPVFFGCGSGPLLSAMLVDFIFATLCRENCREKLIFPTNYLFSRQILRPSLFKGGFFVFIYLLLFDNM